jgi:Fe-S-cluster-containing dehydrogenase component
MENYLYICQYCSKEYKPNRRKKQKYCSNSCRTRAFAIRKISGLNVPSIEIKKPEKTSIEKMSLAGVGNAAVGTLAVNIATSLFIREENKPATKKDLQEVKELLLTRYHPILNMPSKSNGAKPFYDLETQQIIYFNNHR